MDIRTGIIHETRFSIAKFRDPQGQIAQSLKAGLPIAEAKQFAGDLFLAEECWEGNTGLNEGLQNLIVVADAYIGPEETLVEVTDSLTLSDSLLTNKSLLVADSLGLTDSLLSNKTLPLTDSISLIEAILSDKTLNVSDGISLSEALILNKLLRVTDSIASSESLLTDKTLIISDNLALTESLLTNKTLSVTDSIALTDSLLIDKLITLLDSLGLTEVIDKIAVTAFPDLNIILNLRERTISFRVFG